MINTNDILIFERSRKNIKTEKIKNPTAAIFLSIYKTKANRTGLKFIFSENFAQKQKIEVDNYFKLGVSKQNINKWFLIRDIEGYRVRKHIQTKGFYFIINNPFDYIKSKSLSSILEENIEVDNNIFTFSVAHIFNKNELKLIRECKS